MSAAIPTMYAGVQFRSRLEARWAAFFDLMTWPWEYEPLDLDGYIPDFVLSFPAPMIVEVKPLLGGPSSWCRHGHESDAVLEKIARSGWRGEGLLVGATLVEEKHAMGYVEDGKPINAGLLFEVGRSADGCVTGADAIGVYAEPFGFKTCCGGPVDVVGDFSCRRCGHHDKGPRVLSAAQIIAVWRAAGNRVQWRGREARP